MKKLNKLIADPMKTMEIVINHINIQENTIIMEFIFLS
jgi:hypothetical protein